MYGSPDDFNAARRKIMALAGYINAHGGALDVQVSMDFVQAEKAWGDKTMTDGQNLFLWLEARGDPVSPHCHEGAEADTRAIPYDYADLAYALSLDGVPDRGIVGGYLWGSESKYAQGEQGIMYPGFSWRPSILWGGVNDWPHTDRTPDSGLTSMYGLTIVGGQWSEVDQLMARLDAGQYDSKLVNTFFIVFGHPEILQLSSTLNRLDQYFGELGPAARNGSLQYATISQMVEQWQRRGSVPSLWSW
jgi:hypothetical protein